MNSKLHNVLLAIFIVFSVALCTSAVAALLFPVQNISVLAKVLTSGAIGCVFIVIGALLYDEWEWW